MIEKKDELHLNTHTRIHRPTVNQASTNVSEAESFFF
jgi:hypothetical protein